MVDFSKLLSDKKGKRSAKLSMFDIGDEDDGLSMSVVASSVVLADGSLEGLNDQQSDMVVNISDYLKDNSKKEFFLVQGGGGTGKSYSIIRAIQGIDPKFIIAAAPSHFAKNVLQDFLGDLCTSQDLYYLTKEELDSQSALMNILQ